MKRIALPVALALATVLSGCGSDAEQAAPPAPPNPTAATTTYTLAEVKQHRDENSCWTIIEGKVYDVTAWISQHPGGAQRIKGLCGEDGTGQFTGQHAGAEGPQARLASFQIGTLAG